MDVVTKIRDYANKLAASERLLETLESDAAEHRAKVDSYRQATRRRTERYRGHTEHDFRPRRGEGEPQG